VFEALRENAQTCEELARSLALDAEALELALRMLIAAGYLVREGDTYALSETARQTLLTDAAARVRAWVGLHEQAWDWLRGTNDVIRSGQGVDALGQLGDAAAWLTYESAMLETARRLGPLVAPLVPVKPGAATLLDIAGAHGMYGALICREHPPMRSMVLDLPEAVETCRRLAREEGIDDVVTHRGGDALTDDLGAGHDVVFLGNILHLFKPAQIEPLLGRVKSALTPAGTIAIWDMRRPERDDPPDIVGDAYSLFFRVTSAARCYTTSEYLDWLEAAGFSEVQIQPMPVAPFQLLATGRAPS
jgi:hypothetical protein